MSSSLPNEVQPGAPITARSHNQIVQQERKSQVNSLFGRGSELTQLSSGTSLRLPKRSRRRFMGGAAGVVATQFPFQLYQHTPDPDNPTVSDWRTFRVRGGLVNNQHPDNDDTAAIPLDIVVPESSTLYKVYIEVLIDAADGPQQGTVVSSTIMHGSTGWPLFPDQPDGSSTTGAPPDKFYVLIGEITTSDDTAQTVTIPQQNLQRNGWIDMVGFEVTCNTPDGFLLMKRLSFRTI